MIKEHTLCGISLCFGTFFLLLFWRAKLEAERKLNDVRALSWTRDFGPEVWTFVCFRKFCAQSRNLCFIFLLSIKSSFWRLTPRGVLLTDTSVLARAAVAGSSPAATLVHPKHPPAPWPPPFRRVACSDWLPIELQALKAAAEIMWLLVELWRRTKEQRSMGAQHLARLNWGGGHRMLPVQGQPQRGGVDLQQDAVPATVWHHMRANRQWGRGGGSTSVPEEQVSAGQLREEDKGQWDTCTKTREEYVRLSFWV